MSGHRRYGFVFCNRQNVKWPYSNGALSNNMKASLQRAQTWPLWGSHMGSLQNQAHKDLAAPGLLRYNSKVNHPFGNRAMNLFRSNPIAMLLSGLAVFGLCGCSGFEERAETEFSAKPDARILVIGDSVMWWNSESGASVADGISARLGEPVVNLAVPGAVISHRDPAMAEEGLDIRAQYRDRDWQWVVVEGGANDLGDEGGARGCEVVLDELVSDDGRRGEIPELVRRIRSTGARVVAMGYYKLPSSAASDDYCGETLTTLTQRIENMAGHDPDVLFVAMSDVIAPADPGDYDPDGVHPSARSSREIGSRIAAAIAAAEPR